MISKCGKQPRGAPEGGCCSAGSFNVGREGHTYVHFITEILPQEVGVGSSVAKQRESIVVFLQDDIPGIIARMDCVLYLTGVC